MVMDVTGQLANSMQDWDRDVCHKEKSKCLVERRNTPTFKYNERLRYQQVFII